MINNNINDLAPNFKLKVIDFLAECKEKGFDITIFEGKRTPERQAELYRIGRRGLGSEKPVTWTMESYHLTGQAIDIVFKDKNGNPIWKGDYDLLIEIAKKYGIKNLKPKETCHFEDDGIIYKPKTKVMGKYKELMETKLKSLNLSPIFNKHEGEASLSEMDVKCLIEIALADVRKK